MRTNRKLFLGLIVAAVASGPTWAAESCEGYGPQAPRDIDVLEGDNPVVFSIAPPASEMNLCNIHFHVQAEHRAADYSLSVDGEPGFQCTDAPKLSEACVAPLGENHCEGVEPGDTIEVHWVYSSCTVGPGEGLGACLSDACANPNLRVEAQVYQVVNDPGAADFLEVAAVRRGPDGYWQPAALPTTTGAPVEYLGSTTGPSYTEVACSPLQVTWSVRPHCQRLDASTLSAWCADNPFKEGHAHGVRELVEDPSLLSDIH